MRVALAIFVLCSALLRADTLSLADASHVGLAAAASVPTFSLPDQTGRMRDFDSLAGPRGLILVFFRSADWCIYCKSELEQLERDYAALKQSGYGLAAISYDSQAVLDEFARPKGIEFPLLADHESTVIQAFDVVNRAFRKGMQVDVQTETVYLSSLGNVPVYGLSYPAVFVIGPDRKILWRFVSEDAELRLTGSAVLERAVGANIEAYRTASAAGVVKVSATATTTAAALSSRLTVGVEIAMPERVSRLQCGGWERVPQPQLAHESFPMLVRRRRGISRTAAAQISLRRRNAASVRRDDPAHP